MMPAALFDCAVIGLGGALGAMARYGVNAICLHLFKGPFHAGTLLVNVLGGFAIGFLAVLLGAEHATFRARLFLITGFLGGLTTFSAYSIETFKLFHEQHLAAAILNIFANNVFAIGACAFGYVTAKAVFQNI
jgi:CrcB protein